MHKVTVKGNDGEKTLAEQRRDLPWQWRAVGAGVASRG